MTEKNVVNALEVLEYKEASELQLAKYLDFTDRDIEMLKIFWDPAFNDGWIYLSDEIIKGQLTKATGKDAVYDFYRHILLAQNYEENIDYKLISADDELVKTYEKNGSVNLPSQPKAHNRKYYAITGETYKDLLTLASTKKGKECRAYYRKVEKLAIFMRNYMLKLKDNTIQDKDNTIQEKDNTIQEKDNTIQEKDKELIESKSKINILSALKRGPNTYEDEWIYILTCRDMQAASHYKYGIITKNNTPARRLTSYNCGKSDGIHHYYVFLEKCKNATAVESQIKKTCLPYLEDAKSEVIIMPYKRLRKIVQLAISSTADITNELIELENDISQSIVENDLIYPPIVLSEDLPLLTYQPSSPKTPTKYGCSKCEAIYTKPKWLSKHTASKHSE